MKVIILAAGKGTRLGMPHPKCLTKLKTGETILERQIRAISKPYPGAIGCIGNENFRIWEAVICDNILELDGEKPGKHIYLDKSVTPIIKCRDKCLRVTNFEKI